MKITALTTYIVPPRWLFLRVETDEGVTGWGEPIVEGRAHTTGPRLGLLRAARELGPRPAGDPARPAGANRLLARFA